MSKARTVPAHALSRVIAADSSVIPEGRVGRLPPAEFDTLKGLGYVREPTADELKAAEGEQSEIPPAAPASE